MRLGRGQCPWIKTHWLFAILVPATCGQKNHRFSEQLQRPVDDPFWVHLNKFILLFVLLRFQFVFIYLMRTKPCHIIINERFLRLINYCIVNWYYWSLWIEGSNSVGLAQPGKPRRESGVCADWSSESCNYMIWGRETKKIKCKLKLDKFHNFESVQGYPSGCSLGFVDI